MEERNLQPGMLTYKDECGERPAGIGSTVYVISADKVRIADGSPMDGKGFYKIDMTDNGGGMTREKRDGYSITGTVTFEDGDAVKKLKLRFLPHVRLPRREKKRRLNRVIRHLQLKATILLLNAYKPSMGQMLALSLLFPDRPPQLTDVFAQPHYSINQSQAWLLSLLNRRLRKNARRILFRDGGLRLVGHITSDGDIASAEVVVTRRQADLLRQMLAIDELDRREDELLNGKED